MEQFNIQEKSEQEVVQQLRSYGIRVIMKPVALVPNNFTFDNFGKDTIVVIEKDIYETLQQIENRKSLLLFLKDPFSQKV